MAVFSEIVSEMIGTAAAKRQTATLAHLYIQCLRSQASARVQAQLSAQDLETNLLPLSAWPAGWSPALDAPPPCTFLPEAARQNFDRYFANRRPLKRLSDSLLLWLLDGDFDDGNQEECRRICSDHGLDAKMLTEPPEPGRVPEVGSGELVDDAWILRQQGVGKWLVGRDADLERHLGMLTLAVRKRQHYLLEGMPGVGKTAFFRELLRLAATRWANSSDLAVREVRFAVWSPSDFQGSALENRAAFDAIAVYLRRHPLLVPVWDGFDLLVNRALNLHEGFASVFGAALSSPGRTHMLVSRTGPATTSELLRSVKGNPLVPLPAGPTSIAVRNRLADLMEAAGGAQPMRYEKDDEGTFCDRLVGLAAERYPGRFFPEVALHLAESAVSRAVYRAQYLRKGPSGTLCFDDLWEHVAEEQGIGAELLGKNPRQFYQSVGQLLKTQDVIGQDHAVDQVVLALFSESQRPPRRPPRGRFLFVGPPGVGKTELARSLARRLGFGEEAFFAFNMSEYGSEGARTRFMGADPGYVGFKSTRTIYDLVRGHPSCVVLLDEIDRADASIQDILLSILEGEGKDSEGNPAYFSQAIFIMTTNLGQEQVYSEYLAVASVGGCREDLVARLPDSVLRKRILEGVVDQAEVTMRRYLERAMELTKTTFLATVGPASSERTLDGATAPTEKGVHDISGTETIEGYVRLRELHHRMELTRRNSSLDSAFLDRVDFIIPFFPIREPAVLGLIVDLHLRKSGWGDCQRRHETKF